MGDLAVSSWVGGLGISVVDMVKVTTRLPDGEMPCGDVELCQNICNFGERRAREVNKICDEVS